MGARDFNCGAFSCAARCRGWAKLFEPGDIGCAQQGRQKTIWHSGSAACSASEFAAALAGWCARSLPGSRELNGQREGHSVENSDASLGRANCGTSDISTPIYARRKERFELGM